MDGYTGKPGTITGISGGAVVFASSIGPELTEGENAAEAIVFNGNTGRMYGNATLGQDLTIPGNKALTIPAERTLTIPGKRGARIDA
jgi:hypothetical protein